MTKDSWYSRPGIWFWLLIALGAALRVYLVSFTNGTTDVALWESHAHDVLRRGLIGYYHVNSSANHPPLISEVEALFMRAAEATGVPFRIWLRAPFALLDLATTLLLLLVLRECRWRFVAAAAYWLNPLSIIFSAYHGNTDSAIAFFLLLCVWLLSRNQTLLAGAALGVSFWVKLPTVPAIPAFFLWIPNWRARFQFILLVACVGIGTYIPALIQDPVIIWSHVFGYRAQSLHTTAGVVAWGPQVLLFSIIAVPQSWPTAWRAPILFFLKSSWLIALALAVLITWLRRNRRAVSDLCATIGMIYVLILALSDGFSFQYFAWSLPFWFFLPRWFFVPAIVLVSAYVYFLYAFLCGNPWLLGPWSFSSHSHWPVPIIALRDAAYLFFFGGAVWLVVASLLPARNPNLGVPEPTIPASPDRP